MTTFSSLVRVLPYEPAHGDRLLRRGLRPADVTEIWRATGLSPDRVIRQGTAEALAAAAVIIRDDVAAVCAVSLVSMLSGRGAPWLVGHPDFERPETALAVARLSRRFIDHWTAVLGGLENYADPDHQKSLRYLKTLGFTFDWNHLTRGPMGHPLVRFWRQACA